MTCAAGVIIGDEVLSGRVADCNAAALIARLRPHGIALQRLTFIPDDIETIAAEVRACSAAFDLVVTSGGIGPTHDDVTIEGVARGLGRPVVRDPLIAARLRERLGTEINDAALKMADVPEGTRVLDEETFPLLACTNVYILPGVPSMFSGKLETVCRSFTGRPFHSQCLQLHGHESAFAQTMAEVQQAHGGVKIGSYPRFEAGQPVILVVIESREQSLVDAATAELLARLPQVEVSRGSSGSC